MWNVSDTPIIRTATTATTDMTNHNGNNQQHNPMDDNLAMTMIAKVKVM